MKTNTRLTVALLTVFLCSIGVFFVQQSYSFTVANPLQQLSEFPAEFDGWRGTEEEITDGVANILDATETLSLRFQQGGDLPVFVHSSVWTSPDSVAETCPHHPDVCYRGNGWTPTDRRTLQIQVEGVGQVPVQAVVMKRGDQQVTVAFTYRMGDAFFSSKPEARAVQLKLFGTKVWPAVTKFMIQVPDSSITAAEPKINIFVKKFFAWQRVD